MFGVYYAGQSYAGQSGTILHYTIVSDDPTHAQTSTTPSLFQLHYLGIEDALHAQAADSNGIVYVVNSFVDDTLHGQSVDGVIVDYRFVFTPADSTHEHKAQTPILYIIKPSIWSENPKVATGIWSENPNQSAADWRDSFN